MTLDRARVVDCLDLFLETESIGEALDAIEQRDGRCAAIEDARRRQQLLRAVLLEQLKQLRSAGVDVNTQPETVH